MNLIEKMKERRVPEELRKELYLYLMHGRRPGHFLKAVLTNDLQGAVGRADDATMRGLGALVMFIYNEVPIAAKDVDTWCSQSQEEREKIWQSRGVL